MTRYHTVLLERHDVADRQAVTGEVCRMVEVEGLIQTLQGVDLSGRRIKRPGVDQIVVFGLRLDTFLVEPFGVHETEIGSSIITLQLINSVGIAGTFEKRLFTLLANRVHIHRGDLVLNCVPILTGNTEATGEQHNVLCLKCHSLGIAVVEHIDGHITLKQFQCAFLGKRKHIGVGVTVGVHGFNGHGRIGHIAVVGSLYRLFFLHRTSDSINGVCGFGCRSFAFNGNCFGNLCCLQIFQNCDVLKDHRCGSHALDDKHFRSYCTGNRADRRFFDGCGFDHATVQKLFAFLVVQGIVPASVRGLHMKIYRIIHEIKGFLGGSLQNRLGQRQIGLALLHDLSIVPINVGNQLRGSLVDGLKACTKLFQLLVFRPCCNIAEAVFTGCDAVVGTHGKGNAFSLDFLGVAVFLLLGLELIGGDFAAHKVQPLVLGEPQRPALGNIQRFCRKNGTGVIDYHALLDGYGIAGVIVGTTQIIAI